MKLKLERAEILVILGAAGFYIAKTVYSSFDEEKSYNLHNDECSNMEIETKDRSEYCIMNFNSLSQDEWPHLIEDIGLKNMDIAENNEGGNSNNYISSFTSGRLGLNKNSSLFILHDDYSPQLRP